MWKKWKTVPWFLGTMSLAQAIVLVYTLVVNYNNTGEFIQTNPFNFLIGPTTGTLLLTGARYVPCMKPVAPYVNSSIICIPGINPSVPGQPCTLLDFCGMGGFPSGQPNQWYRLIVPIFLHGGVLHYALNMTLQMRAGFGLESEFGSLRIGLIYMISGIGGFLFGANFSPLTPSVGCSGALFGLIACLMIDLVQNWSLVEQPLKNFFVLLGVTIFSFLMGLLPLFDNFAHIGGFVFGFTSGLFLMPLLENQELDSTKPSAFKRMGLNRQNWKRLFMLVGFSLTVLLYVVLFIRFYSNRDDCSWCKYLNCIPGLPWCQDKWNQMGSN
ncbi:rhomboid family-domain-containing protein [Polychytrium aggregatum]|uniref:rhomboid family-domain-containing protein n=1 Tax=Polychytrium aggregatum TaxID=110093 RepID=UPI0022FDD45B|nr:rhomboid family-domain-containing protein [Polychytrium aggregatum]KAI9205827.1 rhomboid family-domain-containing protein [Polychytrium aggregatum]